MEMISKSNRFRGLLAALLLVLVSGFALSACGSEHHEVTGIVEGEPVALGQLEYNVLFTRPLNPNDVEDAEYLVGHKPAPPGSSYIGVFLKVNNLDENKPQTIPDTFTIRTTAGKEYRNLPTDTAYALEPGATIPGGDGLPVIDSTPQVGPIQASMLLFEMADESMENRPVELIIEGEGGPATVELDL
ncbi:MAG: hypothetical protein M9938_06995 [Solirubrobacterales bacterium]|nr:hypothetical protein [Solirubrobacterales bacterium]